LYIPPPAVLDFVLLGRLQPTPLGFCLLVCLLACSLPFSAVL
jgi:hypothetical protein